jgi:hypothetical protein
MNTRATSRTWGLIGLAGILAACQTSEHAEPGETRASLDAPLESFVPVEALSSLATDAPRHSSATRESVTSAASALSSPASRTLTENPTAPVPTRDEDREVRPPRRLASTDLSELDREMDRRIAAERERLLGRSPTDLIELEDLEKDSKSLARKMSVLDDLRSGRSPEALAWQAVEAIRQGDDGSVEAKLLAAAILGRTGSVELRDTLVREVAAEIFCARTPDVAGGGAAPARGNAPGTDPDAPGEVESTTAEPIELEHATAHSGEAEPIATSASALEIDGAAEADAPLATIPPAGSASRTHSEDRLGSKEAKFTVRELIVGPNSSVESAFGPEEIAVFSSGSDCYVFGEFAHFAESIESSADGGGLLYRREFSATLRLVDVEGRVAYSGRFLEHVVSEDGATREAVSFWAVCPLPSTLEPGPYTVIVDGVDHESGTGARASTEILLETP